MYGLWPRHAHDPGRFGLDLVHAVARDHAETVAPPGWARSAAKPRAASGFLSTVGVAARIGP